MGRPTSVAGDAGTGARANGVNTVHRHSPDSPAMATFLDAGVARKKTPPRRRRRLRRPPDLALIFLPLNRPYALGVTEFLGLRAISVVQGN